MHKETYEHMMEHRFKNVKRDSFPILTLKSFYIGDIDSVKNFFRSMQEPSLKKATIYVSNCPIDSTITEKKEIHNAQLNLYKYDFKVEIQKTTREYIFNELEQIKKYFAPIHKNFQWSKIRFLFLIAYRRNNGNDFCVLTHAIISFLI